MTPDSAAPPVIRRYDGAITRLTLNRPEQRNPLSRAMMAQLQQYLEEAAAAPAVRVVVIDATGPAFCAGHDLKEMRAIRDPAVLTALFADCARLMQTITRLPKPVIAAVQGIATAAGCQLVASCDLALAAAEARFATPGVNIGLFCSTPMVALSRAVGRKAALEMLLTGDMIDAATAQAIGLINRAVPADSLAAESLALARRLAQKSPEALAVGKSAFQQQADLPLEAAYDLTAPLMVRAMLGAEAAEGIDAFLSRRPPVWPSSAGLPLPQDSLS